MMLKVNGEYLDFNGDIEIEKKIKLFEDIETADGDLSFEFEINLTSENLRILQIPIPDSISKIVYHNIECIVQNNSGITINNGSLRIEKIIGRSASCSFLGGNSNWFAMLTGDMSELRLSHYDIDQTEATITASWANTEGIVFPFLDLGALITRSFYNAKTEDFVGAFYLHTLFKEVMQQSGLKITGDLLEDSLFNQIVLLTNTRNINDINDRSCFIGKTSTQNIGTTPELVTFTEDSLSPYYGSALFSASRYTADVKLNGTVDVSITWEVGIKTMYVYQNGVEIYSKFAATDNPITFSVFVELEQGDYIEIFAEAPLSAPDILSGSFKFTALFVYSTRGNSTVPLWTKTEFVSNVLRAFNVIPAYNQFTKTVTLDIFDKIKTKQSIDLSDFIKVDEIDYVDFISNYGKVNNFTYQEGSDEDLKRYNITSFVKYGSGQINANNHFAEESADVIDLDLSTPISYINSAFDASLERINFVELIEFLDRSFGSVTDSSGTPHFHVTNADRYFKTNDLIRIFSEDLNDYNGDYVVTTATSTYLIVNGLGYTSSTTGTITKLVHSVTSDDNVYWMINIPVRPASDIMGHTGAYLNQTLYTEWTLAFFNLLMSGKVIESEYKQGLSFGEVDNPLSFQKTLIDKYWQQFERILNDPVKLLTTGNLTWRVYNSIDFLRPISIRTLETSNLYYVNKMVGYKDSSVGCSVELIKLP